MKFLHKLHHWGIGSPTYIQTDLSTYENRLEDIYKSFRSVTNLTNLKLQAYAAELRAQAQSGTDLEELLAPTYALVKEVIHRQLKVKVFDIQVVAAIPLHQRKLIEMQTGEGKTLTAVFPAILNAWQGKGVHILTFNDYLAKRDAQWMGPIYEFLGLSVGYISNEMSFADKKTAYNCDITYATAKEVGFDFLRSKGAFEAQECLLRPFHYAIVDEADAIMIDEARNPLVIAGTMKKNGIDLRKVARLIGSLEAGNDYTFSAEARTVFLTDHGIEKAEAFYGVIDLIEDVHFDLHTSINLSLQAHTLLNKDVDYIVKENRVWLIDEFTGRVVEDRRWRNGLQSAVEAKENLPLQSEGSVLNSISLQHLLQKYPRIAGMTATAQSSATEFAEFYGLETIVIPPNKPSRRTDYPDQIYLDKASKEAALLEEVRNAHRIGQPILIGTLTVRESEHLAQLFRENNIPCQVLNARNDEEEAKIIADAGRIGAVTIATNMAGRGTDIKLGGHNEEERRQVIRYGGLYVMGTNRHESIRIDQQLRGRAGRQGDVGKSRFFISLEDDLMNKYGLKELLPKRFQKLEGTAPILAPKLRKTIRKLQHIIECQLLDMRKSLYQYAAFTEKQRTVIQQERLKILADPKHLIRLFPPLPKLAQANPKQLAWIKTFALLQYDQQWALHLDELAQSRDGVHLVRLGGQNPLNTFRKMADASFTKLYERLEILLRDWIEKVLSGDLSEAETQHLERPASTWTYVINDNPFEDQLSIMLLDNANSGMHVDFVSAPFLFTVAMMRWMKKKRS
ncbi:MAG: hypothetical protein KTR30_14300 [Saprospiraceae bacterium]|nr:hypothetical protein [Saprospiraceae bacterium]